MNPVRHIRRLGVALAGLAGALLAFAAAAPAALALPMPSPPPPGLLQHPPVLPSEPRIVPNPADESPGHVTPASVPTQIQYHTVVTGGMPGWQIALIAVAAALFAAMIAVLADRAWAARRKTITAAA